MQRPGRIAATTVAALAVTAWGPRAQAEPNTGAGSEHLRLDPPSRRDAGVSEVAFPILLLVAPPATAIGSYYIGSTLSGSNHETFILVPLTYALLMGLSTCVAGRVSDGGKGSCPLTVLASIVAVGSAAVAAVAVEPELGIILAWVGPPAAGIATYDLTAYPHVEPTIIVPAEVRHRRPEVWLPVVRVRF